MHFRAGIYSKDTRLSELTQVPQYQRTRHLTPRPPTAASQRHHLHIHTRIPTQPPPLAQRMTSGELTLCPNNKQTQNPGSASAFAIIGLVSFVILAVGSIALGWRHILRFKILPFIFWVLYALFITSTYHSRLEYAQPPPLPQLIKPVQKGIQSIDGYLSSVFYILTLLGISQPDWNGSENCWP